MKSLSDVIATIERELKKDPRPCCLACLGVASQDMYSQVEKHVQEKLSAVYSIENGTCHKKNHQARVIHPRDAVKPLPKL